MQNPSAKADSTQAAISLLSGGLDSTLSLALELEKRAIPLALTFDYGQRAAKREIQAAQAIASHYQIPHRVVDLPWLTALLPHGLSPTGPSPFDTVHDTVGENLKTVWVPNRNAIFLSIGAAFAEAAQAGYVLFGGNRQEAETFADNSRAFCEQMSACFRYSTQSHVEVLAPVISLNKPQMRALAHEKGVPLHLIWSCYEAGNAPCGQCPSCLIST